MNTIEKNTTENSIFENLRRLDESGNEFWTSRQPWKVLEYTEYRHFLPVIEKAKISCTNSGNEVSDHFEDILEMVVIGSGAERELESIKLSRYACYLIVQNADPSKAVVAQGQTYFAVQTRIAEIKQMEEYNALTTEEEQRLFLREELRKHNSQLADAAKAANQTHYEVGAKVRQTIAELGGTMPEELPTASAIKSIENKQLKQLKDPQDEEQ